MRTTARITLGEVAHQVGVSLRFVRDVAGELSVPVRTARCTMPREIAALVTARCHTARSNAPSRVQFRWPDAKESLLRRGLYRLDAQLAVERIALARYVEFRVDTDDLGRRYVEILRDDVHVRLGRDFMTGAPKLITAFSDCVVEPPKTRARVLAVAESVGSTVTLGDRMAKVDELLGVARGR